MARRACNLFGSTVRDEAGAASDLDLFIDHDRQSHCPLIELVGLKQFMEDRIGVSVDLTTRDSLDPLFRARVEASAQRIF